jgi:ubiquinone/menaquinone biosynthesis C-methylase UbiE
VDLSPELLSIAETYARGAGVGERAAFRLGDARRIPFPDASLDLVVSTLSLHHWSDPVAVFGEVARVLKPGGAFYIFDLRRDMPPPFYLVFWAATQIIVPAPLLRINEPMGSRNAAYTPLELGKIAVDSHLSGWQMTAGPVWMVLQGYKA